MKSTIEEIRNLVAENEMEKAIQKLKELRLRTSDIRDEIVAISANQNHLSELRRNNLMNANDIAQRQNQLTFQILDLLNIIEGSQSTPTPTTTTHQVITIP